MDLSSPHVSLNAEPRQAPTGPPAHAVLLLNGTSHALRAEKVLQQTGIPCKLIPIPRHLASDCGVCLRVARADGEAARGALAAAGVEVVAIHAV